MQAGYLVLMILTSTYTNWLHVVFSLHMYRVDFTNASLSSSTVPACEIKKKSFPSFYRYLSPPVSKVVRPLLSRAALNMPKNHQDGP